MSNDIFEEGTEEVVEKVEEKAVATKATVAIDLSSLESALDSSADIEGISIGDIGMKVSKVPIEKYKGSTQKIDRISFITRKVIAIKSHYFEGIGSILCFGKKCCEIDGFPAVRYLFPVVTYSTDNDGNIVGKGLSIKILSAGEDLYKSIITINRASAEMGGIDNIDLMVTCTDDKYQKLTLNQAGKATWKRSQTAVNFVAEKWKADADFAYMAVARKMDEETLLHSLGMDGASAPVGGAQQFDEKNTDLGSFFND